jgi:tetratricopeptide (TPR) repeat protein
LRDADLVVLQEMDPAGTERLARALGVSYVYVPSAVHPVPKQDFGVALLSPWPLEEPCKLLLPHQHRFRKLRRAAAVATLRSPLGPVRVYGIHFESPAGAWDRVRRDQAQAVLADAAGWAGPVVVAGAFDGRAGPQVLARAGFSWPAVKNTAAFDSTTSSPAACARRAMARRRPRRTRRTRATTTRSGRCLRPAPRASRRRSPGLGPARRSAGLYNGRRPAVAGRCEVSFAGRAVTRVFSLAAALGTLSLAPPAPAQEATLAELADRYRRGDRDTALGEIGLWTAEWTEREVENLLRRRPFDPALGFTAALLHVHRALLCAATDPDCSRIHLAAAARLLPAAADTPGCPDCAAFAPRLFLLVGLALQADLDVATAHHLVRAGLRRFAEDPELLTALGIALETGPGMRQYDQPPDAKRRSSPPVIRPGFAVEGDGSRGEWRPLPASSLGDAEAAFRRALAADPGLSEARLRLGRVRLLRGQAREAIEELQRVSREDGSLRRQYLARLFEARAHEKRGDAEGAARAYQAAVAVEPEGQSAWIGLGHALGLLGRREEAEEAFAVALGQRRVRGDPWWTYARGDLDRLEPLLAELQAALAR